MKEENTAGDRQTKQRKRNSNFSQDQQITSCNSSHVFVFSSSSKLLATLTMFCWSDVAPIALLFFIELYCTSCLSISTERESSLKLSLSSSPVFVKLRNFVMTVLKLVEG